MEMQIVSKTKADTIKERVSEKSKLAVSLILSKNLDV
jgi:hypothetical protein